QERQYYTPSGESILKESRSLRRASWHLTAGQCGGHGVPHCCFLFESPRALSGSSRPSLPSPAKDNGGAAGDGDDDEGGAKEEEEEGGLFC
ncbi:hypothetical protein GBF38_003137, partial [Nibea albiflora]